MAVACLGMLGLTHLMLGGLRSGTGANRRRTWRCRPVSGLDEYWVTTAARTVRAGLLTRWRARLEAAREEPWTER